jgi:hypothetical protein
MPKHKHDDDIDFGKPVYPAVLEQSFFQRNRFPLIMGGLGFLVAIGVAMTFTGVLAPIGLTVTTLSSTLLFATAALSLGVLLLAGIKLIYNEAQVIKSEKRYSMELRNYQSPSPSPRESRPRSEAYHHHPIEPPHSSFLTDPWRKGAGPTHPSDFQGSPPSSICL